jgi:thioesterase domain-containing protein
VSGAGGHVFIFRELAARLGPDQPVYAFSAVGADGEDVPRQSVEEIAMAYEAEIERAQLHGPFVVGGYSVGALAANELARRLRRRGHEVLGLIAFDAFAPGYPERMPALERAVAHVEELSRRSFGGRVEYVKERVDNVRRRVLKQIGLAERLAPKVEGADKEREERMKRIWVMLQQAQQSYRPQAVEPGPLLLFVAEHPLTWPATRMDDPTKGWRRYIHGRIDVVTVKGGHLDLFRPDNIDRMAQAVADLIGELTYRRVQMRSATSAMM